eukprot:UN33819
MDIVKTSSSFASVFLAVGLFRLALEGYHIEKESYSYESIDEKCYKLLITDDLQDIIWYLANGGLGLTLIFYLLWLGTRCCQTTFDSLEIVLGVLLLLASGLVFFTCYYIQDYYYWIICAVGFLDLTIIIVYSFFQMCYNKMYPGQEALYGKGIEEMAVLRV